MSKPAFLVEGDLEQDFIQSVCHDVPVRRIGCNGDDVAITAIAKRVGTQARLLQKRCSPIIVVFDRERRRESCEELEADFRAALSAEGVEVELVVGIADRDVETWILADFEMFAELAGVRATGESMNFEGEKGKSKIRQLLPEGATYVETIHGALWLKKATPSRICARSRSFARLFEALKWLDCWWLREQHLL